MSHRDYSYRREPDGKAFWDAVKRVHAYYRELENTNKDETGKKSSKEPKGPSLLVQQLQDAYYRSVKGQGGNEMDGNAPQSASGNTPETVTALNPGAVPLPAIELYEVKQDDTLDSIAAAYNISVYEILRLNKLLLLRPGNEPMVGDTLRLSEAAPVEAPQEEVDKAQERNLAFAKPVFTAVTPSIRVATNISLSFLHNEANIASDHLATHHKGHSLVVFEESADWYYVYDSTNKMYGYVRKTATQPVEGGSPVTANDIERWSAMSAEQIAAERGIKLKDALTIFKVDQDDKGGMGFIKRKLMEGWLPSDGMPEVRTWYEGGLLVIDAWTFSLASLRSREIYKPDTGKVFKWNKSYFTEAQNRNEKHNIYEVRDKPSAIEVDYENAKNYRIPFQGSIYDFGNKYKTFVAYAEAVEKQEEQQQKKALVESGASHSDNRITLIGKLYYISGNLQLYQAAMNEQQSNAQLPVEKQKDTAFRNLVRDAQELLFGPVFYREGTLDDDTYIAIDEWGKRFNGDADAMDRYRLYLRVEREYNARVAEHEQLEKDIQVLSNKVNYEGNQPFSSSASQLLVKQQRLDEISWKGLEKKYSIYNTANLDYKYASHYQEATEFPLQNPFMTEGASTVPSLSSSLRVNILDVTMSSNPDDKKRSEDFYQNFQETSQKSVTKQLDNLDLEIKKKRDELLEDKFIAADPVTGTYKSLLEVYGKGKVANEPWVVNEGIDTSSMFADTGTDYTSIPRNTQSPSLAELNTREYNSVLQKVSDKKYYYTSYPNSNEYIFYSGLVSVLAPFKDNGAVGGFSLLNPQHKRYSAYDLVQLATEVIDAKIMQAKLPSGDIAANQLKAMKGSKERMEEIKDKYGDVERVPAYIVITEGEKQDTQVTISAPGTYSHFNTSRTKNLLDDGIPLGIYLEKTKDGYRLIVDRDGEKLEPEIDDDEVTGRDDAVTKLLKKLENNNKFPAGVLYYVTSDKSIHNIITKEHVTASEVLSYISIALLIASIPFTGGATGVALVTGATVTGMASTVVGMYEKSQTGSLGSGDIAMGTIDLVASLLPMCRMAGKLTKLSNVGQTFAFLEEKAFVASTYTVGVVDAALNGYMLGDEFVQAYDALGDIPDENERNEKIRQLIYTSLLYGLITFHDLMGSVEDMASLKDKSYKGKGFKERKTGEEGTGNKNETNGSDQLNKEGTGNKNETDGTGLKKEKTLNVNDKTNDTGIGGEKKKNNGLKATYKKPNGEIAEIRPNFVATDASPLHYGTDMPTLLSELGLNGIDPYNVSEKDFDLICETLFTKGLPERGTNMNLSEHALHTGESSAYRGTTETLGSMDDSVGATVWAGDGGIVIRIEGNTPGWELNSILGDQHPTRGEQEISILAKVEGNKIKGIYKVYQTPSGFRRKPLIVNPYYK